MKKPGKRKFELKSSLLQVESENRNSTLSAGNDESFANNQSQISDLHKIPEAFGEGEGSTGGTGAGLPTIEISLNDMNIMQKYTKKHRKKETFNINKP